MLIDYSQVKNVFLVCGKTDLRRGIDGLAQIVSYEFNLDVYDDALFMSCGNRNDRFKMLHWDGDGFLLLYKRLEEGKLQWPKNKSEVKLLTSQQVRWLLEGLKVEQPRAITQASKGIF